MVVQAQFLFDPGSTNVFTIYMHPSTSNTLNITASSVGTYSTNTGTDVDLITRASLGTAAYSNASVFDTNGAAAVVGLNSTNNTTGASNELRALVLSVTNGVTTNLTDVLGSLITVTSNKFGAIGVSISGAGDSRANGFYTNNNLGYAFWGYPEYQCGQMLLYFAGAWQIAVGTPGNEAGADLLYYSTTVNLDNTSWYRWNGAAPIPVVLYPVLKDYYTTKIPSSQLTGEKTYLNSTWLESNATNGMAAGDFRIVNSNGLRQLSIWMSNSVPIYKQLAP